MPNSVLTTLMGNGSKMCSGVPSGGWAPSIGATVNDVWGLASDARSQAVYFYDRQCVRVRALNYSTALVANVAGGGVATAAFFDGPLSSAQFNNADGVLVDGKSNVYVSDSGNGRIRYLDFASGLSSTLAGGGLAFADGPSTTARFNYPIGMALDGAGGGASSRVLFVADYNNNRVRALNLRSLVTSTLAGSGSGFADGVGSLAAFKFPSSLVYDSSSGYLFITDSGNFRIRVLNSVSGAVWTLAGTGAAAAGDGYALSATFLSPTGLAFDEASGNLTIADSTRVRRISCWAPGGYYCSNAALALCPAGSWCPPNSLTGPIACAQGFYGSSPGLSNASCSGNCTGGYFGAASGLTLSTCSGVCNPGYYCPPGSALATSTSGQLCPVGSYCPWATAYPIPCPQGTWGSSLSLSTASCTGACPPGMYGSGVGGISQATACLLCPAGSISTSPQSLSCAPCAPGSWAAAGSSACTACLPGSYCNGAGANASACVSCPLGSYGLLGGATIAGCIACPQGTASGAPLASSPAACAPCRPGFIAPTQGSPACAPCQPGYYVDQAGQGACTPCPMGSFSDGLAGNASASCLSCSAGRYNPFTGSTSAACQPCSPGTYSAGLYVTSSLACAPCPVGAASSASGATACTACAQNFYRGAADSPLACLACPPNFLTASTGASQCVAVSGSPAPSPSELASGTPSSSPCASVSPSTASSTSASPSPSVTPGVTPSASTSPTTTPPPTGTPHASIDMSAIIAAAVAAANGGSQGSFSSTGALLGTIGGAILVGFSLVAIALYMRSIKKVALVRKMTRGGSSSFAQDSTYEGGEVDAAASSGGGASEGGLKRGREAGDGDSRPATGRPAASFGVVNPMAGQRGGRAAAWLQDDPLAPTASSSSATELEKGADPGADGQSSKVVFQPNKTGGRASKASSVPSTSDYAPKQEVFVAIAASSTIEEDDEL